MFFVLFYLYLAFEVDLRLLYNCGGLIENFPAFFWTSEFLKEQVGAPGGLVEYAAAFLSQSLYYSWAGAAVVTVQAWLMSFGTDAFLKAAGVPRLRFLRFAGPIILLALYSQYVFHFTTTLAFLVELAAAWLFLKFTPRSPLRRGAVFVAAMVLLFAGTGAPCLLFGLLCGLAKILQGNRRREGLLWLAAGAAVPLLIGVLLWRVPAIQAYTEGLPVNVAVRENESPKLMMRAVWILYLSLPTAMVVVGLWRWMTHRSTNATKASRIRAARKSENPAAQSIRARPAALYWAAEALLLAIAIAATLHFYRDPNLKALFEVDYYSKQGEWTKVLDTARRAPPHYLIAHAVYRALYHTGRLGDEMFAYPQIPSALLLTGKPARWQKADTCLDLGLVNEAEYSLLYSMKAFGHRPLLLQRLARVYLIKGDLNTASVYLNALSKVPFWGSRARADVEHLCNNPDVLEREDAIQQCRGVQLKEDSVWQNDVIGQLLAENPRNRMAYEYGMALLLLNKNLEGLVRVFNTYNRTAETGIPRHYEEALLIAKSYNAGPVDLAGRSISEKSMRRFEAFMQALQPFGQNLSAARKALKVGFGDSYYYYFFLGGSGTR